MAGLGLIHVRGRLCKYESKAKGNRRASSKAGQFVACRPAGKRGWATVKSKSATATPGKRKSKSAGSRKGLSCTTVHTKMFGQGRRKQCREICRRKGKIVTNTPCRTGKRR